MNAESHPTPRVLMTADTVGGVWTYAVDLIAALAPHNVHVSLATLGDAVSPSQRRQIESLSNVDLFESTYKLEWMNDPWDDVRRSGEWLLDLEARVRPDVVHLNGYAHGRRPFAAPVVTVAHSCCLSWWRAVKNETPPAFWDRYRGEVTVGLAGADAIVAPSRAMLESVETFYAPAASTRVIYNGRPAGRFAQATKRDVIFSAGRLWDEAKNIAALCAVAADVRWPIEVAGNATRPDGGGVHTRGVSLLGVLDEASVARRMASAAIYALPAKYEPFGLSVLEAALSGCALVLGDIPSLREIWGDAAMYVSSTDELRHTLQRLMDDSPARHALAARSLARAKRYGIESTAVAYAGLYQELITVAEVVA